MNATQVMNIVAIVLAAVVAALLSPPSGKPARWGLRDRGAPVGPALRPGRAAVVVGAAGAAAVLVFARGSLLALGLIIIAAVMAAGRLFAGARARREAARREERVLEVCEVLVGELRAGRPPVSALVSCAEVWPDLSNVATAARLGADVPAAFRRLGESPGAAELGHVAGAWQVSQGSGAGLAVSLAQVATSARESASTHRLVASELASAKATARLVAGLPLVALAMGSGIGGDPWQFLLVTPAGLACLACGLALAFCGLTWMDRIAVAVMSR